MFSKIRTGTFTGQTV